MALVCLDHMSPEDFYDAFEDEKPKEDLKAKKNAAKDESTSVDNDETEDKKE